MYGVPVPESELPESIDWEAVVSLAKRHVVLGIIVDSVQYLPEDLRPQPDISAKMGRFALGLIRTNMILDNTLARLVEFLRQHGINGVVLKGQGVARYYRMPQMRQSGDIDFYVGRGQYGRAVDLCLANLADDRERFDEEWKAIHAGEQHFDFKMCGVVVELHRLASRMFSPVLNKRFQDWAVGQLEHSTDRRTVAIGNTEVTLPSYDFDAIYIFYHAWRHCVDGGIGLRQVCDWAMIFHAHAADIDAARLKDTIGRLGLTKAWKLFACIAVGRLGVSPDKMPLYDPAFLAKSGKLLGRIIDGGNFGYYSDAFVKPRRKAYGLSYCWDLFLNMTRTLRDFFPVIPAEAPFFYLDGLYHGVVSFVKKARRGS